MGSARPRPADILAKRKMVRMSIQEIDRIAITLGNFNFRNAWISLQIHTDRDSKIFFLKL